MSKKHWQVEKTLLIVGEGYHDEAFLNHVKRLPGATGNGVKITIKNARGKGALNVIDHAIRQSKNIKYDRVAALFDADTDWNESAARMARRANIHVLLADPCFEAMLLRCIERGPAGNSPLKNQLEPFVQSKPTEPASYSMYFGLDALKASRNREKTIDELLKLFNL